MRKLYSGFKNRENDYLDIVKFHLNFRNVFRNITDVDDYLKVCCFEDAENLK